MNSSIRGDNGVTNSRVRFPKRDSPRPPRRQPQNLHLPPGVPRPRNHSGEDFVEEYDEYDQHVQSSIRKKPRHVSPKLSETREPPPSLSTQQKKRRTSL